MKAGHPESGYIIKIILYNDDFTVNDEYNTIFPNLNFVNQYCRTITWHYVLGYKNFYGTLDKDADY